MVTIMSTVTEAIGDVLSELLGDIEVDLLYYSGCSQLNGSTRGTFVPPGGQCGGLVTFFALRSRSARLCGRTPHAKACRKAKAAERRKTAARRTVADRECITEKLGSTGAVYASLVGPCGGLGASGTL